MKYQLIIVGAGPGGYVAAIRGAQLGLEVALVEHGELGGVCLNHGCIPTKTLQASAVLYHQIKKAAQYGLMVNRADVDWEKVIFRQKEVVEKLKKGIEFLLQKNQVEVIKGAASFWGEKSLIVIANDGREQKISGDNIILATGSKPIIPPNLGYNGVDVVTSKEALNLSSLPQKVVIIGGGYIGCEFASILAAFGCEVTIIELKSRLLPLMEMEISKRLTLALKKNGIKILTSSKVKEVLHEAGGPKVVMEDGSKIDTDYVLLSLGRRPDTSGLSLDSIHPGCMELTEEGRIKVDDQMRTNLPWLYAVGDVNSVPYDLAHVASKQGIKAVENIVGLEKKMEYNAVPSCIFTIPEAASVGLTVDEARAKGFKIKTGKFPMMANGKALAMGDTEGFVLAVMEEATHRLLGVHMLGPHVTDLIAEASLAVDKKLTAEDLADVIHAHPTIAETVMEAAEAALGEAIHI